MTNNAYAYYHSVVDKRASSSRQDKTSPKLGVNAGMRREETNKEKHMDTALHILQHSLGLDQYGQGKQYRNHFVTGEGSRDFTFCRELVAKGLMTERTDHPLAGGDSVFYVTPNGIDYVALNSPKRPPAPKLTRSQKRYREWLDAESSLTFAEWIGVKPKNSWGRTWN